MDEKKVREAIEIINNFTVWNIDELWLDCEDMEELVNTLTIALEKQLPKKPKENEIRGGWFGKQKNYTCPTCGNCLLTEMMNERQNTSYCWDCGQRLDWSE